MPAGKATFTHGFSTSDLLLRASLAERLNPSTISATLATSSLNFLASDHELKPPLAQPTWTRNSHDRLPTSLPSLEPHAQKPQFPPAVKKSSLKTARSILFAGPARLLCHHSFQMLKWLWLKNRGTYKSRPFRRATPSTSLDPMLGPSPTPIAPCKETS